MIIRIKRTENSEWAETYFSDLFYEVVAEPCQEGMTRTLPDADIAFGKLLRILLFTRQITLGDVSEILDLKYYAMEVVL